MMVFFFQAEDGIRHLYVTGVQTCALPILSFRLVQRRTSHTPNGDARIAPNEMTRPMTNTTVPPMPPRTRRMRGMGLDVTGEAGDSAAIESVIDLFWTERAA